MESKYEGNGWGILEDRDGQLHYSTGEHGRPLGVVEALVAREILRLAGRVKELEGTDRRKQEIIDDTEQARLELLADNRRLDAKIAQLRSQRDEEKQRADDERGLKHSALNEVKDLRGALQIVREERDRYRKTARELEQDACDSRRTADADQNRALALEAQVAEYEETRRAMARKNLDLAREKAVLANRVKELEKRPVKVLDAVAIEGAVQPYRDEVAYLNRLLDATTEKMIEARTALALTVEGAEIQGKRSAEQQARIGELEQENRRLRDGITSALARLRSIPSVVILGAESTLRRALDGPADVAAVMGNPEPDQPLTVPGHPAHTEPVTREKLEEMSERVREIRQENQERIRAERDRVRERRADHCPTCGGFPYTEGEG